MEGTMDVVLFVEVPIHPMGVCHIKELTNEPLHPRADNHASVATQEKKLL